MGVGFSLHAKSSTDLLSLELSLGIAGPASLAENTQDTTHGLRKIDKASGWDNQLDNEPTLNLSFRHNHRLFEASATPSSSSSMATPSPITRVSTKSPSSAPSPSVTKNGVPPTPTPTAPKNSMVKTGGNFSAP